uniref:Uncharacterized protein n=1 Tax=Glossina pallidipes TaxID=7398 RepID=A0A1A9Z5K3_GLOPL
MEQLRKHFSRFSQLTYNGTSTEGLQKLERVIIYTNRMRKVYTHTRLNSEKLNNIMQTTNSTIEVNDSPLLGSLTRNTSEQHRDGEYFPIIPKEAAFSIALSCVVCSVHLYVDSCTNQTTKLKFIFGAQYQTLKLLVKFLIRAQRKAIIGGSLIQIMDYDNGRQVDLIHLLVSGSNCTTRTGIWRRSRVAADRPILSSIDLVVDFYSALCKK